ncbi:MAG: hypothetical protein WDM96_00560 [Lacunisphaera sp.]
MNTPSPPAAENEITIAVIGLDPSLEGEEGDSPASSSGGDRDIIELPKVQLEFLLELRKSARKLIVVLTRRQRDRRARGGRHRRRRAPGLVPGLRRRAARWPT